MVYLKWRYLALVKIRLTSFTKASLLWYWLEVNFFSIDLISKGILIRGYQSDQWWYRSNQERLPCWRLRGRAMPICVSSYCRWSVDMRWGMCVPSVCVALDSRPWSSRTLLAITPVQGARWDCSHPLFFLRSAPHQGLPDLCRSDTTLWADRSLTKMHGRTTCFYSLMISLTEL